MGRPYFNSTARGVSEDCWAYKLIVVFDKQDFEKQVAEAMNEQWELVGGVSVVGSGWVQALRGAEFKE